MNVRDKLRAEPLADLQGNREIILDLLAQSALPAQERVTLTGLLGLIDAEIETRAALGLDHPAGRGEGETT